MIYGLNFGAPPIPDEVRTLFRDRVQFEGNSYMLVGACQSKQELYLMAVQANNGRRKLHAIERKGWLAFYAH